MIQANPAPIIKEASRKRLSNFARYIKPDTIFAPFHLVYYKALDLFAHGHIRKLIVQQPPQHGKSEGSSRILPAYMLGLNPNLKICIGSYSSTIAEDFNQDVQRIIQGEEFQMLFPESFTAGMRKDVNDRSYKCNTQRTDMVNHRGGLRAVGRGGPLTSKTVDVSILDDVYKDPAEGNSPVIREAAWKWYTGVVRSRLHNDSQELIVFTRWHDDDLIGRIEKSGETIIDAKKWTDLDNVPQRAWVRINFEALKTTEPSELDPRQIGEALWPEKHSLEQILEQKALDPVLFNCLYQGNPGGAEGRLYHPFKTYTDKDEFGRYIRTGCYVDVADEGDDYLTAYTYEIRESGNSTFNEKTKRFEPILYALITDIEYTNENTEVTTITVPQLINRNGVQRVWVESNNGGSQFEKVISRKIKALTKPFYQGGNKESRIITASAMVNSLIIFPFGWEKRFEKCATHITNFLRNFGANEHDDAEDALTGIYEKELADGNNKPYSSAGGGIKVHN